MTIKQGTERISRKDVRESLDAIARRYPQYIDYADTWNWSVALRDVSTKGGTVMLAGDYVLADCENERVGGRYGKPRAFLTVWSARRDCAVSVDKAFLLTSNDTLSTWI